MVPVPMSSMSVRPPGRGAVAVNSGDEVRYDRRWYGDDAAVDFPSAASAVERIRPRFFSHERRQPLQASLSLSPADARTGSRSRSMFRFDTRAASAAGEASRGGAVRACDGSGVQFSVDRFRVRVPPGVTDGTIFPLLPDPAPPPHDPRRAAHQAGALPARGGALARRSLHARWSEAQPR